MPIKNHHNHIATDKLNESTRGRPIGPATGRAKLTRAELQYWLERAKSLPDIRWEKVEAVREAMTKNRYDIDSRLDDLLEDLPDDWAAVIRNRRSTK
jgi:hypothetical protein